MINLILILIVGGLIGWVASKIMGTDPQQGILLNVIVGIVGALLAVGISASGLATGFGFVALILASINIFGGFLVTQRMLAMYKKKEK